MLLCVLRNNEAGSSSVLFKVYPVEIGSGDRLFFKFFGCSKLLSFCISECRESWHGSALLQQVDNSWKSQYIADMMQLDDGETDHNHAVE